MFDISVKDNIIFGQKESSDAEVWLAASMANVIQFIERDCKDLTAEEELDIVYEETMYRCGKLHLYKIEQMCEISDNLIFLSCLRNIFHYADDLFIDWL